MFFTQTPVYLYKKLYPRAVFNLIHQKEIALTFDDGPVSEVTEYVLDVLKHYDIRATFFCVGENVVKHFNVFEKIVKDNHSVGNHTYTHMNGWKMRTEDYIKNVKKFNELYPTKLFRPPYGKITLSEYKQLLNDYDIIFWSIITYDYHSQMSPEKCINLLKRKTVGGQIVLFHDSIKSIRLISKVLPFYIEFCQKLNLTFVPLKKNYCL